MDLTNKTRAPLSVPLPGGKKLFLGPGKTGQVSDKALTHPPLAALLESGDLTQSGGNFKPTAPGDSSGPAPGTRHGGSGAMRQSGDR